MVIYEVNTKNFINHAVIELQDDEVYIDTKSIAFISGNISVSSPDSLAELVSTGIKSQVLGKQFTKELYSGSGKIYLKPQYSTYHKSLVNTEEDQSPLIIKAENLVAFSPSIKYKVTVETSVNNFLSGSPLLTMQVTGKGTVLLLAPGSLEEESIINGKFDAYSENVVAYSKGLIISRNKAKGYANFIRSYTGTGKVYFSPHAHILHFFKK